MPAKQNESGIFWFIFSPPQSIVFRQFFGKSIRKREQSQKFHAASLPWRHFLSHKWHLIHFQRFRTWASHLDVVLIHIVSLLFARYLYRRLVLCVILIIYFINLSVLAPGLGPSPLRPSLRSFFTSYSLPASCVFLPFVRPSALPCYEGRK